MLFIVSLYCVVAASSIIHNCMPFYLLSFVYHLHLYLTDLALWLQHTKKICQLTKK